MRGDNRFFVCEIEQNNIRDVLENHEENKNKDLSSTIYEYVSLECTPFFEIWICESLTVRI